MKMIMAIIQHDDEQDTISELNQNNFLSQNYPPPADF